MTELEDIISIENGLSFQYSFQYPNAPFVKFEVYCCLVSNLLSTTGFSRTSMYVSVLNYSTIRNFPHGYTHFSPPIDLLSKNFC